MLATLISLQMMMTPAPKLPISVNATEQSSKDGSQSGEDVPYRGGSRRE